MSGDHGPRLLHITPSRFQWHKFKDLFHFYILLGVIPLTALVFCVNIFIGPATLTPIPEDYTPKHWEHHRVCRRLSQGCFIEFLWFFFAHFIYT